MTAAPALAEITCYLADPSDLSRPMVLGYGYTREAAISDAYARLAVFLAEEWENCPHWREQLEEYGQTPEDTYDEWEVLEIE